MEQNTDRIVVGLDDSTGGRAALGFALHDAARRSATVEVIAAFEIPDYWSTMYAYAPLGPSGTTTLDEIREATHNAATRIVDEVRFLPANSFLMLPAVTVTAIAGSAAGALLDAAQGADLLVVGSRGHGGFASMVLGSVSLQCVLHATCPVTVVHPSPAAVEEQAPAQHATPAMS